MYSLWKVTNKRRYHYFILIILLLTKRLLPTDNNIMCLFVFPSLGRTDLSQQRTIVTVDRFRGNRLDYWRSKYYYVDYWVDSKPCLQFTAGDVGLACVLSARQHARLTRVRAFVRDVTSVCLCVCCPFPVNPVTAGDQLQYIVCCERIYWKFCDHRSFIRVQIFE